MDELAAGSGLEVARVTAGAEGAASALAWLMDELAHGVIVASAQGRVLHTNNAARLELARQRPLSLHEGSLHVRDPKQAKLLLQALEKGGMGRRSVVGLRAPSGSTLSVAVVPLRQESTGAAPRVGLFLSRAAVVDPLMLCFFARAHNLTNSEEQVLGILCQGCSTPEIAAQLNVAVSTIRSHVRSLCAKTHTNSVRTLVARLAVLPPLGAPLQQVVH